MQYLIYNYYFLELPTWGEIFCNIITRIAWILPSSNGVTMATLAAELGNNVPFVGAGLFYMFLSDLSKVLVLVVGYKLIKVIPVRL